MPVDPNEPTYCLCHQVSYGEMIGCDNPDVSTHFHGNNNPGRGLLIILYLTLTTFLFPVPCGVVSFSLCGAHNKAKGKMVLSKMFCRQKEKIV